MTTKQDESSDSLISEFNLRKYKREDYSLVDGTEYLSNVKEQVISFYLEPTKEKVYFKAFITTFTDTFTPSYNTTQVFGRTDPIHIYQNTTRTISLAFDVPASSESEAFENLGRVQKLIQMLYPGYTRLDDALTLSEAPLVRLKVMNLLGSNKASEGDSTNDESSTTDKKTFDTYYTKYKSTHQPDAGTLGVITSCTMQHNLENPQHGVFEKGPNTVLPKTISVSLSFTPFHEETIGRMTNGRYEIAATEGLDQAAKQFRNDLKTFPYGVDLGPEGDENIKPAGVGQTKAEQLKRTAEEARRAASNAQQHEDKKTARYLRTASQFLNAETDSGQERRAERRMGRAAGRLGEDNIDAANEAVIDLYAAEQAATAAEKEYQDFIK